MGKYLSQHWRRLVIGLILCIVATVIVINHESSQTNDSTKASKDQTVVLTISGEVKSPGSYTVKYGSSIMDNLSLFGGFTMNADVSKADVNSPLTKDKSVTIKPRASSDSHDYDSLYELPD